MDVLRETQERLAEQVRDLSRLYDLSSRLEQTHELPEQLLAILQCAAAAHGTTQGLICLYDDSIKRLVVAARAGFDDAAVRALGSVEPGTGASGRAFIERRRVIVMDTETDPSVAPYRELARATNVRAVHSVPLISGAGEAMGALSVHFATPHFPSEREMHQADLLAQKAVLYIERRRAEEALRASTRRLEEADRRKDQFLATLAHELRNPLAPMRNALHFMQLRGSRDPEMQNARDMIDRQVRQMVRLVDDLMEVSRITLGQIQLQSEIVPLAIVITNAVEVSRPLIDAARHHLTVELPSEPLYVEGDSTRLSQVLQNLLNNAAKYTPPGGQITLRADRDGDMAIIRVRDTGIGIPPAMLDRVFEMFTQVDRGSALSQGGLGIGLALAQQLTQMHGGRIDVTSDGTGRGSEFTVRLPLCAAPSAAAAPADRAGAFHRPTRRRVLVADDNIDGAESLRLNLEIDGHEVRAVFDGAAAVSLAEEFRPHFMVLDLGMPKLDGYEVCRRVRERPWGDAVTIIALTGWGQEHDRRRTLEAGFDRHLVKPVDPAYLAKLIGEADESGPIAAVG
ncbi:MAG TPA: ATP-binding protein [Steroidobacteraceae bacterium]|nr:ATP-binding protein [Steroidobacteraceae bacterium]